MEGEKSQDVPGAGGVKKTSLEEVLWKEVKRQINEGQQHGKGHERLEASNFFFFPLFFLKKSPNDLGGLEIDRAVEHAKDYIYLLFQNCHHTAKHFYLCPWLFVNYLHF